MNYGIEEMGKEEIIMILVGMAAFIVLSYMFILGMIGTLT